MALNKVVERNGFIGNAQTHRGFAMGKLLCALLGRKTAARSWIDQLFAEVRSRSGMQVGSRAKAGIYQPLFIQSLECRPVCLVAIVLKIRAFIPGKAQRFEITLHGVDELWLAAFPVEVFNAQHHSAALRFRYKPCHQGREDIARMHAARRRRRKPPFDMRSLNFHKPKLTTAPARTRRHHSTPRTFRYSLRENSREIAAFLAASFSRNDSVEVDRPDF